LFYIFRYYYLHISATVSCKLRPHPRTQLMPHPRTQGFYLRHIYFCLSRNESIDAVLPSGVVTWFLCYFDWRKYFLGCEMSLNPRMKVIRTLYPLSPERWLGWSVHSICFGRLVSLLSSIYRIWNWLVNLNPFWSELTFFGSCGNICRIDVPFESPTEMYIRTREM
jgi:hypothetical protein